MPARLRAFLHAMLLAVTGPSSVGKHPLWVLSELPPQDLQRGCVERDGNRPTILRLTRVHPRMTGRQVHTRPLQTEHIRLAQSRGQGEEHDIPLMRRQLTEECCCLLRGDRALPPGGFLEH